MRIVDALSAPWAIRPDTLRTMIEVYERHSAGEKTDLAALQAAMGRPLDNKPTPYEVSDGVAIINLDGVLAKRMDAFMRISGGSSTQRLQQELSQALADDQVHSILLNIDSPGGEVDGTQTLADAVFEARGRKRIVALADGTMASAAYWIGSAADEVFIADDTTSVGSIGVVAAHQDISKAQDMRGVKTTEVTAGKYKRIASNYAPLSQEGHQSIQEQVDHIYSVFVNDVARNRNADAGTVLSTMADGRVFVGQQAIDAGLVDGKSSLSKLLVRLSDRPAGRLTMAAVRADAAVPHYATAAATRKMFTEMGLMIGFEEAARIGTARKSGTIPANDPLIVARLAQLHRHEAQKQGRSLSIETAIQEVKKCFGNA